MPNPSPSTGSPLTAALVEFHKKVGTIHETSKAQYGSYADLATVLGEILPKLAECDIRLSQTFRPWPSDDGLGTMLVTSLKHVSGEEERSELPLTIPTSNRGNPLHDFGGAVTYQRRYAVLAMLGLAAGIPDDDGDAFDQAKPASTNKPARAAAKPAPASKPQKPAPAPAAPAVPAASPDALNAIKKAILGLNPDQRSQLVEAFRLQYGTPEGVGIADHIKTQEHIDFLSQTIAHVTGTDS
jgi:hypothetical protein